MVEQTALVKPTKKNVLSKENISMFSKNEQYNKELLAGVLSDEDRNCWIAKCWKIHLV